MSDGISLWEIESGISEAMAQAEETGDESALVVLNAYLDGRREKVDKIGSFILSCEVAASNISDEIARLQARKSVFDNRAKRTKEYVKKVMEVNDKKKLEGDKFTLTVRGTSPSVVILDESAIPSKFMDVKTTYSPRKKDIKAAIERQEPVPGATLSIGGTTLVVK